MIAMEAYGDFASVYDIFMEDTPYAEWADFAVRVIEKYGISRPVRGEERMRDAPEASGRERSGMRCGQSGIWWWSLAAARAR